MNDLFDNWIYETSPDNKARFVLGEKGDNPLVCIGVNPSTAEPGKLDPTLRRVKGFANDLGYDGWIMLNLYPQRTTDPDGLHKEIDIRLACHNVSTCAKALRQYTSLTVWAAWGALVEKRNYLRGCLNDMCVTLPSMRSECEFKWITLGDLTQAGHPRHPLYLPKTAEVRDFDVEQYLQMLRGGV